MKRAWVEFRPDIWPGHVGHGSWEGPWQGKKWRRLPPDEWDPPVRPVPGKGYAHIFAEFDGFVFEFVSTFEMLKAAAVLERHLVDRLTSQHNWYRKLPASVKSKHSRERVAAFLREVAAAYEAQLAELVRMPSSVPPGPGKRAAPTVRADIRL
jgi:hypothetical protein